MEEMNAAMARLGQSVSDRDINRLTLRHVEQREVGTPASLLRNVSNPSGSCFRARLIVFTRN
jgi:hypothetical protein